MMRNYGKFLATFSKRQWRLSDNFYMSSSHSDWVNNPITKHQNHPSVEKIRKTITVTSAFRFSGGYKADAGNSIGNLNSSKVGTLKKHFNKMPQSDFWYR